MAAHSQPTEVQSREHARQALKLLLEEGDRLAALQEALRGLPGTPKNTDLEAYPEAWSALWRAFASRSIRLTGATPTFGALSPDGIRAVVSPEVSDPITPNTRQSATIINPLTSSVVGVPILSQNPMPGGLIGAAGLSVSPDGRLVAISFVGDKTTHIVRLADGVILTSFPAISSRGAFSPDSHAIAFNAVPPGSLSNAPHLLEVRDTQSGAVVFETSLPPHSSLAWISGSEFVVASPSGDISFNARASLMVINTSGEEYPIANDQEITMGRVIASPTMSAFLIQSEQRTDLFEITGTRRATLPPASGGATFVRNGTVVAIPRWPESERISDMQVETYALDGTRLDTQPSDHAVFEQFLYGPTGQILGTLSHMMQGSPYEGISSPSGLDLHEAAVALVGKPTVQGDPEVDATLQISEDFARKAERLLQSGDRQGAMAAALKGLPADPAEDDFVRYQAAHLLLYRAVASRTLRLPLDRAKGTVVAPTGEVLAISGEAPALYSTSDGRLISQLLRDDASTYVSATHPHFSPSGDLLALAENQQPVLHIHDGRTGAIVTTITFSGVGTGSSAYSTTLDPVGFSHDADAFAVLSRNALFIVSTQDWSVAEFDFPGRTKPYASWLPDGRLVMIEPIHSPGGGPVAQLYIHDGRTVTPIHEILSDPDGLRSTPVSMHASRQGSALIAEDGDSSDDRTVIFDGDGQVRAVATGHDGYVHFVRDGTAIAYRDLRGDIGKSLAIHSLTGENLTPQLEDYPVFDQFVFNESGEIKIGGAMTPGAPLFRGEGTPKGRALFDLAVSLLPEDVLTEVKARRIELE
ncbi:hypothetical protein [Primorskyibacter flagellatus]|uniref:Uncharacterized protein n=1 Tax=Primorskyibacter flagellatus TaxID=1387277 RepID=A0A1W2DZB8_9RHOB|nr:hypothetical protein [Primorskyibacter flagellatus]SMD02905.1 hypothetical protein SAMN06295998_1203 [Primorskyibacter flagellatus]